MTLKAQLETINYELIKSNDFSEIQKLLKASRPPPEGLGIFYLDLRGPSTNHVIEKLPTIYDASRTYFDQRQEDKLKDKREGVERGYKNFTHFETFEIARDEEVAKSLQLPIELHSVARELSIASSVCEMITKDIVSALASALRPTQPFAIDGPSESGFKVALITDAAEEGKVIAGKHTDMGLLTCLFYTAPTVEIAIVGANDWALVDVVDGCALVNIADALQSQSGNRLFSPLHRVVQSNGKNLSALYLLRPAYIGD
ncbi:hypothetical protein F5884DRAFT_894762 [Xylogone sp. PMI_703]|nr:hypothetical protein F5884DRAFT_894762 [Xylogone sp. PMI_703]